MKQVNRLWSSVTEVGGLNEKLLELLIFLRRRTEVEEQKTFRSALFSFVKFCCNVPSFTKEVKKVTVVYK